MGPNFKVWLKKCLGPPRINIEKCKMRNIYECSFTLSLLYYEIF